METPVDEMVSALEGTIVQAIGRTPRVRLTDADAPTSPAVYVLRYIGTLACYRDAVSHELPVYVGESTNVSARLGRHVRKLRCSHDLKPEDFVVSWLPMRAPATKLAEAVLIDLLDPVWNCVVTGFGSNRQGSNRTGQAQSVWASMHGGNATEQGVCRLDRAARDRAVRDHLSRQVAMQHGAAAMDPAQRAA